MGYDYGIVGCSAAARTMYGYCKPNPGAPAWQTADANCLVGNAQNDLPTTCDEIDTEYSWVLECLCGECRNPGIDMGFPNTMIWSTTVPSCNTTLPEKLYQTTSCADPTLG